MDTVKAAQEAMLIIQVMNNIERNQTKSYAILADVEAVKICRFLMFQLQSIDRLLTMPTVQADPELTETYIQQSREVAQLISELQHQLLMNAKPKPEITES